VHSLVIVEKNGTLRLCLDPRDVNKVVKCEHYRIPTVQEISNHLAGKVVFSTLDLKDGYWKVEVDEDSSLLCTFNTPFGCYHFTCMTFGLTSASEVFQKKNESGLNRPASIPTCERRHLKLSHMDLYSDSINLEEKYNSVLHSE